MQLTNIILSALVGAGAMAFPTSNSVNSTSNHTLEARESKRAYVGTYDDIGSTCQSSRDGPGNIKPKMGYDKCTHFHRDFGSGIEIFWGAEMNEKNNLCVYHDFDCKVTAWCWTHEHGKFIRDCHMEDEIMNDTVWESAKMW